MSHKTKLVLLFIIEQLLMLTLLITVASKFDLGTYSILVGLLIVYRLVVSSREVLKTKKIKQFYRVCNPSTQQGLWYHFDGDYTGLIHDKFSFCKNNKLLMDFDRELVGYLSATESLDVLYNWFSIEDIKELQKHGWYIHVYETDDYKFYERFQHQIINQSKSKLIKKIVL